MGYRLSKIYTRTGDDGSTGLADGSRIAKHALRVEAMGSLDELNCHVGLLIELLNADDCLIAPLRRIQHHLFDSGGELAIPGSKIIQARQVTWLETQLDELNADLPPLKNFILPGGSLPAAQAHMARAVCRRAERIFVALGHGEGHKAGHEDVINIHSRHYLNRLSDLLFVIARVLARRKHAQEVLWQAGQ